MALSQEASGAQQWKEAIRKDWTEAAPGWCKGEYRFEQQSRAATEAMIEAARLRSGMRVLDLACGAGGPAIAAALAVGQTGHVVATDLVPEMVAFAEQHARQRGLSNMSFQQADAESLPFPDQSFDAVTCRMGIMFFQEVGRAVREIVRVLKPGGRATFVALGTLQGAPEQNPWQSAVIGTLRRYVQTSPPPAGSPHPFRFAQPGSLSTVLREGELQQVVEETRVVPWVWHGPPEEYWQYRQESSPVILGLLRQVLPDQLPQVTAEVLAAIGEYYDGQQINFTASIVVASGARKSARN